MFHALPKLPHPILTPCLAGELDHFGERHQIAPIQAVADSTDAKVKCRIEIIRTTFVIRENVKRPDFGVCRFNVAQAQPPACQSGTSSKSIRARRAASPRSNRPRSTARTVCRLKGSGSLRRFGKLVARSLNDVLEINIQGFSHSQHCLQGGIPFAGFNVGNHLRRKAGFLGNEVFGELAPLALLLKQRNGFHTQGLGVSTHP